MDPELYHWTVINVRGQQLHIGFWDYGMVSDLTGFGPLARCVDWYTTEDFEFEEGEELDVQRWLIKFIDGEPVGINLESLHGLEYGDGE